MDGEAQASAASDRKRGGWITFPFIIATMTGMTLAAGGWWLNLIVYLIKEFNVKSIDAAQTFNIVSGCTTLFPVIGAIIADSYLGCFSVIWISSLISLLGIVLLILTAKLDSLRPQPCKDGSNSCTTPSTIQFTILYSALALTTLGMAGSKFTLGTMGADQFDKPKHQGTFFNWYFFTMYTATLGSALAIVYVEDNVSWGWGFGICIMANVLGLAFFIMGGRFYRHVKPQGSPFTGLAHVVVAAIRKRKVILSLRSEDYYQGPDDGIAKMRAVTPTKSFEFLNRAALKTEGDMQSNGLTIKPWKLCTVQQVEDFKTIIKIFPLWSTGTFIATPLAIQSSLMVLQALTMDRQIGPHFKIPAGSMIVFVLISTSLFLTIKDKLLHPMWQKLIRRSPTPLQLIGVGHVLNILSMAVSAIVESKRIKIARNHQDGSIVPMSVLWLVPPLVIVGFAEAFHFPGQVALYYQEFPESLKSTSTAMVALFIGIAYYLSTALTSFLRRVTEWLPDDINHGRLDNVYWVLVVGGLFNFGFYLVYAWFYKYKDAEKVVDDGFSPDQ